MKIAFYMDDGLEQIVLTPDSEFERGLLKKLHDGSRDLSIKQGGFYASQGGWIRESASDRYGFAQRPLDEASTMIVLRPKPPTVTVTAQGEGYNKAPPVEPSALTVEYRPLRNDERGMRCPSDCGCVGECRIMSGLYPYPIIRQ